MKKPGEDHDDAAQRPLERRLLAPEDAARYLGLSSRFAVYRLVSSGRVPAVRLGSRLRLDLHDLDRVIDEAKNARPSAPRPSAGRRLALRQVPQDLAPRRRGRVTAPVTASRTVV